MTIIDLEAVMDSRETAALEADAGRWDALHDAILETMLLSRLDDTAVISASLRALLDILTASGTSLEAAQVQVAATLQAFFSGRPAASA